MTDCVPQDGELQLRFEKYKEILRELTLMSDIFMRNVLKKKECTEYVLQVIMEQVNLKIMDQIIQKDYKNLQGRSAILDCVARDMERKQFNIEVQQENDGATPKRARYHSGLLDMNTLEAGQKFDELSETYVILITREDVLNGELPIYHIERTINENGERFGDGTHIIYVNAEIQDDTELGKLMHDFHCKKAGEMYSSILASRVRELKETPKGVGFMCKEMDQIYQEGILKGREAGMQAGMQAGMEVGEVKKAKETVILLLEMGLPIDKIAQAVNYSVQKVQEWIAESMNLA